MLRLPCCPQFHGPAALALTCGFLATLSNRGDWLRCRSLLCFGFGRSSQAGRQHHGLLLACKTAGLSRKGIIVFTDDVNLLSLLLRRTATQCFELGAVIPIGSTWTPLTTRAAWTETWAAGSRWGRRTRDGRRGSSSFGGPIWRIGSAWCRGRWTSDWLLELHKLPWRDRFSHAAGHARSCGSPWSSWCPRTASVGVAIASDRLADQFQRVGTAAGWCAGCTRFPRACRCSWTCRTPLALGDTCSGALWCTNT